MARRGRVAGRRTWPHGDGPHDGDGGSVSASARPLIMAAAARHEGAQTAARETSGLSTREPPRRSDCEVGWLAGQNIYARMSSSTSLR